MYPRLGTPELTSRASTSKLYILAIYLKTRKSRIRIKHATNLPTRAHIFQKQRNWQMAYY